MTRLRTLRRRVELGLIVLATIITVSMYALAGLGRTASIPADIGPFLGMVLGLLVAAHLVMRRVAPDADGLLLPLAALLNGIGYVFIVRLDESLAPFQALWTAVGIVAFAATLLVVRRPRDLQRYRYTLMLIGLLLLVAPLLPVIGFERLGAKIWVSIGPVTFQPGEFAKVALAVFFAGYLVDRRELLAVSTFRVGPVMLPDPKHAGPLLAAWGVSIGIMVLQQDLGSSLLFFTMFLVMLWVATERTSYVGIGLFLFSIGAYLSYGWFGHVRQRVRIWLDPFDPELIRNEGFQIVQAAYALAFGGLTGTGLGLGNPTRVPVVTTDFIFVAIGEELGLVGATAVLAAYLLMIGSGLRIAVQADGAFEKLLAVGLTTLVGFQAFIIMAGVTRLLPLTGITLPFVSYGGSSLVANYVLLALLLRISDDTTARQLRRMEREAAMSG